MLQRSTRMLSLAVAVLSMSGSVAGPGTVAATGTDTDGLVAHEWGTFTTVAGENGEAVQWIPLGGPTDLPCFVYTFKNRWFKTLQPGWMVPEQTRGPQVGPQVGPQIGPDFGKPLDYITARTGLKGTVRMETPVLYFYAPRPTSVNVAVQFQKGLFTEWYPNAQVAQYPTFEKLLVNGSPIAEMAWQNVTVNAAPSARPAFLTEPEPSHYYAARETDAAPIEVNGEDEKFLFYRGVAGFAPPIAATPAGDDGAIAIRNRSDAMIPRVILFTKKGNRFDYRTHGPLRAQEQVVLTAGVTSHAQRTATGHAGASRPTSATGRTFAELRTELERLLVAEGLYAREASAMVETWRDSWFEDGTRVFYIVPPSFVDAILPLKITPKPSAVVRVFVGRMDVITPAEIRAVETAFAKADRATLEGHGRLLGPIADRILARTPDGSTRTQMRSLLDRVLASHIADVTRCEAGPPPAPVPTASAAPLGAPQAMAR